MLKNLLFIVALLAVSLPTYGVDEKQEKPYIVVIDTKTQYIFKADPKIKLPAVHPRTGKETITKAMYCEKWRDLRQVEGRSPHRNSDRQSGGVLLSDPQGTVDRGGEDSQRPEVHRGHQAETVVAGEIDAHPLGAADKALAWRREWLAPRQPRQTSAAGIFAGRRLVACELRGATPVVDRTRGSRSSACSGSSRPVADVTIQERRRLSAGRAPSEGAAPLDLSGDRKATECQRNSISSKCWRRSTTCATGSRPGPGCRPSWAPVERNQALLKRVLPGSKRLRMRLESPLVVATFGGTGTGKSSLVNALVGEEVDAGLGRQRPTTRKPQIITHSESDPRLLGLPLDECEVVQRNAEILRDIVILDCPDPDTNETETAGSNLARLHALLPYCDVLIYCSTQQKYRSNRVVTELGQAAAGCRLVFVQTHADLDEDIREDWQKQLRAHSGSPRRLLRRFA
ncbi:MAG: GTPase domain-containing protein [Minicystis sp.]